MTIQTRVQSLQLATAGLRPVVGARLPGTLYVNLPDSQLGVVDPLKTPIDLLPVRFFSSLGSYSPGAYVRNGGFIYRCIANVTPAAFNPAQWSQLFSSQDVVGVYMPIAGGTFTGPIHAPSGSTMPDYMPLAGGTFTGPIIVPIGSVIAGYMPVTGGTFTGPVTIPSGSTVLGYMPTTGGAFSGPIVAPAGSTIVGYLPLVGGFLSGSLILAFDPSQPLEAATKQYVDAQIASVGGGDGGGGPPVTGDFLPLAGGSMTGDIDMTGTSSVVFDGPAGVGRQISATVNGVKRWDIDMNTGLAETGANAGSNWGVIAYDDNGVQLSSWNTNRASGRLTFNGVNAAPHSVANYPPDVGSASIVLNRAGSGHNCGIVASSGGANRWGVALSDATPETGGNTGSNFSISGIADDGHAGLGEVDFNRMSMRMTINGVGAPVHSIVTYPPDVGSATMVLNRASSGHNCGIIASSAGLNRWSLNLSDANPEGSGDNGSDFDITSFKNDGKTPLAAVNINRANGRVSLNAVGATPRSITTYPPGVGSSNLILNSAVGSGASALIGSQNGLNRWTLELGDGATESGSDSGSSFVVLSSHDAGTQKEVVFSATRASGQVAFTHAISNGPSDRTLKENIAPLEGALDKVLALQGVSFNLIATPDKPEIGLIAQDVAPVVPEIVQEYPHYGADGRDPEPKLSLDYPKLTALLIEAIKELVARVETLEGELAK